jgi:hypothetical protein
LVQAEADLGGPLPVSLRALLAATDGVFGEPGQWECLWPVSRISAEAPTWWAAGAPTSFLPFGDNGAGDPLCIEVAGPDIGKIVEWSAIDLSSTIDWPNLKAWWRAWGPAP